MQTFSAISRARHRCYTFTGVTIKLVRDEKSRSGDGGFFFLRSVPNAATYALELIIAAACYVGLAATPLILPSLNPTGTPLWPPTGFALALFLLSGPRMWPAILLGSFSFSAIATRSLISPGFAAAGTALAGFAGAWLIDRWSIWAQDLRHAPRHGKIRARGLRPDRAHWRYRRAWRRDACRRRRRQQLGGMARDRNKLVARRRGRGPDHRSRRRAVGLRRLAALGRWNVAETTAIYLLAAAIGFLAFGPPVEGALEAAQPYRVLLGFLIVVPLIWSALARQPPQRRDHGADILRDRDLGTGSRRCARGDGHRRPSAAAPVCALDRRLTAAARAQRGDRLHPGRPKRACCARRSN